MEHEQPEVIVHVGTNDMGRKREEVLKNVNGVLGKRLKSWTSRVVITANKRDYSQCHVLVEVETGR